MNPVIENIKSRMDEVRAAFESALASASLTEALEEARVRFMGKKGELTAMLRSLGKLSSEERPAVGQALNVLRDEMEQKIEARRAELRDAENEKREKEERIDVTLPPRGRAAGVFHPVFQTMHELVNIMQGLGYSVALGPEREEEHYNFDCLNMPSWHPARDMQDTFYFPTGKDALVSRAAPDAPACERPDSAQNKSGGRTLLRTHTSPVQVRSMLKYGAPLRIVCPGKTYRRDNDPTHSPMFHQMEGLLVDRDVPFSVLKGTISEMTSAFFGRPLKNRFRASYFPFTEPSMELDIECVECSGHNPGCRVCKGTGWLEVGGMGMVHPEVLRAGGIDPSVFNGFAFGFGLDRMAMLKYGISDLRLLFDGNVSYFLSSRGDA